MPRETDPSLSSDQFLRLSPIDPDLQRRAVLGVCALADDAAHAREVLDQLDLNAQELFPSRRAS